jgi:glycosyltransferase involved in cell wall biosynthesis
MSDSETERVKINAYLVDSLSREIESHPVDPYTRYIYDRAREFYWTVSRALRYVRSQIDRWRGLPPPSESLGQDIPAPAERRRLLVDMTNTVESGTRTGIQRVVREIARQCALLGVGIPVIISEGRILRYYRSAEQAEEIEPGPGDVLLLLDAAWNNVGVYPAVMRSVKEKGGKLVVVVYDILPLIHPALFNRDVAADFAAWFDEIVCASDAAVAISRATAESLAAYRRQRGREGAFPIGWWPLGADFAKGAAGEPSARAKQVAAGPPYFLSVGTLEPRKGYPVALEAFERLWAKGRDISYVIVGRPGWNTRALQQRLRSHPEAGRRLHWFDSAGDADLQLLYAHARGAVSAAVAEGFGLPLVEAALRGAPVIASDIPVFREVAGAGARYFDLVDPAGLAAAIEDALEAPRTAPQIKTISWRESAQALARLLREEDFQLREG